jgi:hypothetical protein
VIYPLYTDYSICAYQKINEQAAHRNFRLASLLAEVGQQCAARLTRVRPQIIHYPGRIAITWEDGVVNCLDHAIIGNQRYALE